VATAAALMHPVRDVLDNSVNGVLEEAVPCGRTGSKIVARPAGAMGVIGARRPLSTGRPVQGRQVDDATRVPIAPTGGVRFGVYTGPMRKMTSVLAVSAAVVGMVGR
jgi:hypothetical protein